MQYNNYNQGIHNTQYSEAFHADFESVNDLENI